MSFLWPWFLLLLMLIPLLVAFYIWILRRKRRYAVRYSSLSLIREALNRHARWRQHLPFVLFLLAVACLSTAVARPVAVVSIPLSRTTVILAVDLSRSMCATDISPNRLTVAQEAVLAFIEDQADDVRIGIVAFAGFAEVVVLPTNEKDALKKAVENFTTAIGTAIGSATLKSIDAIAEINEAVTPSGVHLDAGDDAASLEMDFYQPDIIVVLTDGANTHGPLPLDAAHKAADRQVRVYTIGFGTTDPGQIVCTPKQLGSDAFGSSGGSGLGDWFDPSYFRRYLILDEKTLRGMADLTGGAYYRAQDVKQLYTVFANLPKEIALQKERIEITVLFTTLGAAFSVAAAALALLWHRFP
jgi:Ca-activated chloride channel family protein